MSKTLQTFPPRPVLKAQHDFPVGRSPCSLWGQLPDGEIFGILDFPIFSAPYESKSRVYDFPRWHVSCLEHKNLVYKHSRKRDFVIMNRSARIKLMAGLAKLLDLGHISAFWISSVRISIELIKIIINILHFVRDLWTVKNKLFCY